MGIGRHGWRQLYGNFHDLGSASSGMTFQPNVTLIGHEVFILAVWRFA